MVEVILYCVCVCWSEASEGGLDVCVVLIFDIFISLSTVVEFVFTDLLFNCRGCRRLSSSTVVWRFIRIVVRGAMCVRTVGWLGVVVWLMRRVGACGAV